MADLRILPITRSDARAFIAKHHSHHWPPNTWIACCAVANGGGVVCVAILEQPKARMLCNGTTAEVSRVASDGAAKNAASMCLAAITRAAIALGYRRLISYLLLGEAGTSYRAAGWWPTARSAGGSWDRPSRPRDIRDSVQRGEKVRWEFGPDAAPRDDALLAEVTAAAGTIELQGRVGRGRQASLFGDEGSAA